MLRMLQLEGGDTMTRKHYRALAEVIGAHVDATLAGSTERKTVAAMARDIASTCKRDNPRFRFDRFFAAAGLNEWGE